MAARGGRFFRRSSADHSADETDQTARAAGRKGVAPKGGRSGKDTTPRRKRMFGHWHNWRLPTKITAVVIAPVIFAIALGVAHIAEQIELTEHYEELGRQVEARDKAQPLLTGIQAERTVAVSVLAGVPGSPEALQKVMAKVDEGVKQAPSVLGEVGASDPATAARYDELRKQFVAMIGIRKAVLAGQIDPVAAVEGYNRVVTGLLSLERAVIRGVDDAEMNATVLSLYELSGAEDEIRVQQALAGAGFARGNFTEGEVTAIEDSRVRLAAKLTEFRASTTPEQFASYERTTLAPQAGAREAALDLVLASEGDPDEAEAPYPSAQQWNADSQVVIGGMTKIRTELSDQLHQRAVNLREDASDSAGLQSVILLSALIIAAFIITLVARHLLGLLAALRRSALHTASRELPDAVARIRHGEQVSTEIAEVPVRTTEEIGEVARAFDGMHRQALTLAVEQASLRRGYSDSFVNVSRRSQSLLERQLRLFEKLEQDEQDPDQLSTLFQLDHLATRMRRNNENLMVLSGSDLARRFTRPTPLADVLRAAVSEIEHYPRVVVQPPPTVKLVGYAASDLVRVVAELLDNAANFSAPDTAVTVSATQGADGSIDLDVLDDGIGMGERDLARANSRLADPDESDLSTSRRLGLLVVSRLTARHAITARLHGGADVEGVRANLHLPSEIIATGEQAAPPQGRRHPAPKRPTPSPEPSNGAARPATPGAAGAETSSGAATSKGLPRRSPAESMTGTGLPQREPRPTGMPQVSAAPPQSTPPASTPQATPPASTPPGTPPQSTRPPNAPPVNTPPQGTPPASPPPTREAPAPPIPQPTPRDQQPREERQRGLFEPVREETGSADPTGQVTGSPAEPPAPPPSNSGLPQRTPGANPAVSPSSAASATGRAPGLGETTEWFQPSVDDAQAQSGQPAGPDGHAWPAEEPQPTQAETSGLPRRTPQAQNDIPRSNAARTQRTPEDLRGKLSGYQQATQQGASPAASPPSGAAAWNFDTDQAAQRAEEAANPQPSDFTAAGLPRRTPRAQLAPGSAPSRSATPERPAAEQQRNPDDVRGRLTEFQSGARRGRHSAPDRT